MSEIKYKKLTKKEEQNEEEKDKRIQIAVRFLMNPDISNTSDDVKKQFLKKKGLTDEDIERAFTLMKEKVVEQQEKVQVKSAVNSYQINQLANFTLSDEQLNEKIERAKSSDTMILRQLSIMNIPDQIFDLENIKVLILSFNKLKIIPDQIGKLQNLKILHAVSCDLQDNQISDKLWDLKNLQELNLSRNSMIYVDKVVQLEGLKILDLSYNSILQLPFDINKLSELILLNLACNNISRLPASIRGLNKLKKLILGKNLLNEDYKQIIKEMVDNPRELLQMISDQIDNL